MVQYTYNNYCNKNNYKINWTFNNPIEDSMAELIGDGDGIEFIWGLGFKHILVEIKTLFRKIEDITKEEKELYQNKNYLITNLSHDLKTPLTSIINSIYILKNETLSEKEKKGQIEILEKNLESKF